jgi:cellulose biosynthesis protein BcsQ
MLEPYVVTVSSEKGGVGKTTLATNLAIYLKALNEELPVTLFSFDNHFSVDRMFRLGRTLPKGDMLDLLSGTPVEHLLELGEYGVQFIPSSRKLESIATRMNRYDILARALAGSTLKGIVIIDTRPILDIFTQNALFASDRVIVPVKDTPSLENCRNLYDFFEDQGLSKRPLRLLPCLIDSRVHYDGPFKNAYQLLKGYAINRGYRCLEGYIAKSPKVESLNTNPEGKIYPVLTHGRGTNVHFQFAHLARQIFIGAKDEPQRRLDEIRQGLEQQEQTRDENFHTRRDLVLPDCPICGRQLVRHNAMEPASYFYTTSDHQVAGFLDEACFSSLVFRHCYHTQKKISPTDPLVDLFRESALRSYFVLRHADDNPATGAHNLLFYRFDDEGFEISHKSIEYRKNETRFLHKGPSALYRLASQTLFSEATPIKERFLFIRRINSEFPEEILLDENYARLDAAMQYIGSKLPSNPED